MFGGDASPWNSDPNANSWHGSDQAANAIALSREQSVRRGTDAAAALAASEAGNGQVRARTRCMLHAVLLLCCVHIEVGRGRAGGLCARVEG
jgi:hypothetical protein